jgi:hypothetical protein
MTAISGLAFNCAVPTTEIWRLFGRLLLASETEEKAIKAKTLMNFIEAPC